MLHTAQLLHRPGLDAADAVATEPQALADLLHGPDFIVHEPITEPHDQPILRVELAKCGFDVAHQSLARGLVVNFANRLIVQCVVEVAELGGVRRDAQQRVKALFVGEAVKHELRVLGGDLEVFGDAAAGRLMLDLRPQRRGLGARPGDA